MLMYDTGDVTSNGSGKPANCDEWLASIGMQQYSTVLKKAGFEDLETVSTLEAADFKDIQQFSKASIPPGHQKRYSRGLSPNCLPSLMQALSELQHTALDILAEFF